MTGVIPIVDSQAEEIVIWRFIGKWLPYAIETFRFGTSAREVHVIWLQGLTLMGYEHLVAHIGNLHKKQCVNANAANGARCGIRIRVDRHESGVKKVLPVFPVNYVPNNRKRILLLDADIEKSFAFLLLVLSFNSKHHYLGDDCRRKTENRDCKLPNFGQFFQLLFGEISEQERRRSRAGNSWARYFCWHCCGILAPLYRIGIVHHVLGFSFDRKIFVLWTKIRGRRR